MMINKTQMKKKTNESRIPFSKYASYSSCLDESLSEVGKV